MKPILGLDIGGTKCAALLAVIRNGINIIDKIRFNTQPERGVESVLEELYQSIDAILLHNNLTPGQIQAIGISCGGPLESKRGIILSPPNLPGWVNIPLPAMLTQRYGIPAFLQNDANACALVEWKLGAGRGTQDMIFLTMGTGMGAGIIAEGRLLRGSTDMGGEVGHLRLAEDGPVGFGKAGSFEGFTSGGGIARQAQAFTQAFTQAQIESGRLPRWTLEGITLADITAKNIAEYARQGDTDAIALFERVGTKLGQGLALLVDTLNPERIVIGSIFTRCEDLLRPSMEAALRAEAIPYSLEGCTIVPAQTGEELGDLASIMTALYAMGIDPMVTDSEMPPRVRTHLIRLEERRPELREVLPSITQAYETMRDAFASGGKLLICGNGGSCADALHIVGELMKGFYLPRPLPDSEQSALRPTLGENASKLQGALPAIALGEHSSLNTAFANDVDAALVYAQQVVGYGRPGDVLLGISTSGNACNVLLAAHTAKVRGLTVVGLTGSGGGALAKAADITIAVPATVTAEVQELHLPVYHTLCAMLESYFYGEES
ncbi:hypothetical protein FACS1894184_13100 [Clostridia bacterium]|nr:hypothetical protein FACS1894184_13100 [Clostridia bacterium]